MSSLHRHLHHADHRAAFRLVRSRQAWATIAVVVVVTAVLLLAPREAIWKFSALLILAVAFSVFSQRNWRCPQCRSPLPYGRVPETLTCPRCEAVLAWPRHHL